MSLLELRIAGLREREEDLATPVQIELALADHELFFEPRETLHCLHGFDVGHHGAVGNVVGPEVGHITLEQAHVLDKLALELQLERAKVVRHRLGLVNKRPPPRSQH